MPPTEPDKQEEGMVPRNFILRRDQADWLIDEAHRDSRESGSRVTQASIVRDALDAERAKRDKRRSQAAAA